jgi:hypothetical protein
MYTLSVPDLRHGQVQLVNKTRYEPRRANVPSHLVAAHAKTQVAITAIAESGQSHSMSFPFAHLTQDLWYNYT